MRLIALIGMFMLLCGCEQSETIINMETTATGNRLWLMVCQQNMQERSFSLFSTVNETYANWTSVYRAGGNPLVLLPHGKGVWAVFPSGGVWGYEYQEGVLHPKNITPEMMGVTFVAAGGQGNDVYALSRAGEGAQLWKLTDGQWKKTGPVLPTPLFSGTLQLGVFGHTPIVAWEKERGIRLFCWNDASGIWEPYNSGFRLPVGVPAWQLTCSSDQVEILGLQMDMKGHFAVQSFVNNGAEFQNGVMKTFEKGSPLFAIQCFAMRRHLGRLLLFVSDGQQISVAMAGEHDEAFSAPIEPFNMTEESIETPGYLSFVAIAFFMALLLRQVMVQRRAARLPPPHLDAPSQKGGAKESPLVAMERVQLDHLRRTMPGIGFGGVASPLERAFAFFLDTLILFPFTMGFFSAAGVNWEVALTDPHRVMEQVNASLGAGMLAFFVFVTTYTSVAEYIWGATLGKWVMGLSVRSVGGGRADGWRILVRNLLRWVDMQSLPVFGQTVPFFFALVSMMFSRANQRIGDRFAKTVVTRRVPLSRRRIVLASSSPRRVDLLRTLGIGFDVAHPEVNEFVGGEQTPESAVMLISQRKADAVARELTGVEIVIGADTCIIHDGERIGKPVTRDDAVGILKRLSGSVHRVVTGVTVIDRGTGRLVSVHDMTEVRFRHLSDEEIQAYVDSGESDGKAGAYAIQEQGARFVEGLQGSLSNVIGLPLELMRDVLSELES